MGDYTYSKPKVGRSIARAKQTSSKLLSIFLAIIMVTTVFSSIVIADDPGTDPVGDNTVDDDSSTNTDTTQRGKIGGILKELINRIRENRKGLLSLGLVTRYQKDGSPDIKETSTRMRLLLPTGIDIDGDGDNDIRVWIFRRPALDLSPPALAWKTTILVRRLSGMDEDMINDFFEVYLEYNPRVPSGLIRLLSEDDERFARIRLGYQSPAGEEIPKYCIVSHKDIPHFMYPKQKNAHRVSINPGPIAGKDQQLNLLFSIADMKDDAVLSELNLQINHSHAVKSEFSIEREKKHFVRRGQTLEISRNNVNSNVSLYVKEGPLFGGSLTVESLPKEITLGWKLARTGYVEINTKGSKTGAIKYKVDGAVDVGFKPETALDLRIDWKSPYLLGRLLQKGYNFEVSGGADAILSDFYVHAETIDWTMSKFSLNLGGGGGVYNFKLLKSQLDTVYVEVENVDVSMEDSVMTLIPPEAPEKPTVSIASPEDGDTVNGTAVVISGTAASAPEGKGIQFVEVAIDDGEWFEAEGTETWSYKWNSKTVANGVHKIEARCYDGDNYGFDSIHVTVNNVGVNWYPTVEITSPSKLVDQVVSGIVPISGTAFDKDGDDLSVTVEIYDILGMFNITESIIKEEVTVDESGNWVYDWDTTNLTAGLYTIYAQAFDGKEYSLSPASVDVWVRLKCILDFNLQKASVDITNFAIHGESGSLLNVSSFNASGNGSLEIFEGAISAKASGSLEVQDFSVNMTNESGETTHSVDNLNADIYGYGMVLLSPAEMALELNASIYLDVDGLYIADIPKLGTLNLGECIIRGEGLFSAGFELGDSSITIGGYGDKDEVIIEATNLKINVSGAQGKYFEVGANQITMKGSGNITLSENYKEIQGSLDEFTVDNLYVKSDLALLAFSGSITSLQDGTITIEGNRSNFSISYDGEKSLEIVEPKVTLRTDLGTVIAYADSVTTSREGYAHFFYEKDDLNDTATCIVNWDKICFEGLIISYDDLSFPAGDLICGYGELMFVLSSVVYIEYGNGWINITIGAEGIMHLIAYVNLYNNDIVGYIDIDMLVENEGGLFIINVSWLNNDASYIDGRSSTDIDVFDLWIKDKINVSIGKFTGNFVIHSEGGNWTLDTIHGVSGSNLYFSRHLYLLGGFFSINIESIETSGGMRFHKSDKNISITSLGEDVKNIYLQGLYVKNLLSPATILEELGLTLTGMGTTVSVYLGENETKIEAIFTPNASVTIDTLWRYSILGDILGKPEIRLHKVSLTAPTTIIINNEDKSKLLTCDLDGKLTAKAIVIDSTFYLYGVSIEASDVSFSIGKPDSGGISFETSGAVDFHVGTLINKNNGKISTHLPDFNINFAGKGTIAINDHLLDILAGAADLSIGGSVEEQVTISFKVSLEILEKYLPILGKKIRGYNHVIEIDPGEFYIIFSDITDMLQPGANNGIFLYFESYGRYYLHNPNSLLNPYIPIYEGRGLFEIAGSINSLKINPLDVDFSFDLTTNGDHCIRDKLNISGDRDGLVNVSAGGQNGDIYASIKLDWNGTKYWTTERMRFASDKEAHVDFECGFDSDTGTAVFETSQATVTITYAQYQSQPQSQTTVTITNNFGEVVAVINMNAQGEIVSVSGGSNPLNNQPQNPQNGENLPQDPEYVQELLDNIIDTDFWFWIWNPFEDSWFKLWPLPIGGDEDGPTLGPAVSLFARKTDTPTSYVNFPNEIRPGDSVNFNAWYRPMDDGVNTSGPYEFTFDFGDNSSYVATANATNDPINIHSEDHLYTALETYEVTVTVTDINHSDEVSTDTMTINVIEKFFNVPTGGFNWNYYDVDEGGNITGSFTIYNKANKTYSSSSILNWSLINETSHWGKNWTIEPNSGQINPEESATVDVKFTPGSPGNYGYNNTDKQYIKVINYDDPEESKNISLKLSYGILNIIHDTPTNVHIEKGGTITNESLFWVFSDRWETLEWEISDISFNFNQSYIDYQFSMTNGTIYPWDPPAAIKFTLDASNTKFVGGDIQLTLQRINDSADSYTFNITIITVDEGAFADWIISPDNHEDTDWRRESDAYDGKPHISWSVYKKLGANGWSDVLVLKFDDTTTISGYKIKARNSPGLDKMNISLFNNGDAGPVYTETFTSWPKYGYKEKDFGDDEYDVDKVEIKFHEKGLAGFNVHRAFVYEFYVNEVI